MALVYIFELVFLNVNSTPITASTTHSRDRLGMEGPPDPQHTTHALVTRTSNSNPKPLVRILQLLPNLIYANYPLEIVSEVIGSH